MATKLTQIVERYRDHDSTPEIEDVRWLAQQLKNAMTALLILRNQASHSPCKSVSFDMVCKKLGEMTEALKLPCESDIFRSITDEEMEERKDELLTEQEVEEALEQGRKESELFDKSIPTPKGHYR